jgi:hypothetical protein
MHLTDLLSVHFISHSGSYGVFFLLAYIYVFLLMEKKGKTVYSVLYTDVQPLAYQYFLCVPPLAACRALTNFLKIGFAIYVQTKAISVSPVTY